MRYFLIFVISFFLFLNLSAQSVSGIWKNYDDDQVQSHIKVFEKDGKLYAEVVELFAHSKVKVCKKCKGKDKNKSLIGMLIFHDLVKKDAKWVDGKILNPKKGKKYDCLVELMDDKTLKVRGYVGKPLFGKSFFLA